MPYYTPTENANLIKKLEDSSNELAALRSQLAEARKVIEPFANCADAIHPESPDRLVFWAVDQVRGEPISLGQLRAASKWLKEHPAT